MTKHLSASIFIMIQILLLSLDLNEVDGMKCYECSSQRYSAFYCDDPFNKSKSVLQDCGTKDAIGCVKMEAGGNVMRSCAMRPESLLCENKEFYCSVCYHDGCNTAHSLHSSQFHQTINILIIPLTLSISFIIYNNYNLNFNLRN